MNYRRKIEADTRVDSVTPDGHGRFVVDLKDGFCFPFGAVEGAGFGCEFADTLKEAFELLEGIEPGTHV